RLFVVSIEPRWFEIRFKPFYKIHNACNILLIRKLLTKYILNMPLLLWVLLLYNGKRTFMKVFGSASYYLSSSRNYFFFPRVA
ncbi:hypothetical protein, partial [Enterobacter cloacae complex sp. 4DZ3-17B2]|uniref:hypothetical protein n=1 Tax=Enterobacter cloacae complex sp. 4DZ3-17B2 TaxID=2511990 RepID=UPI001CA4E3E3